MAAKEMHLKLLVDKEKNRVVYAESGNDFVDVLFSFLTLPIGTIISLTEKQSKVGSMSKLYESVENIDVNLLQAEACKDMLLHPKSSSEEQLNNLKVNINSTNMTKYYICSSWTCCTETHYLISTVLDAPCRCGRQMNRNVCKKQPKVVAEGKDGVFVKGDVIYMISDDLQVFPVSTASALSLVKNLGFEERNVSVNKEKVLHLLKLLLFSKTPLTDVFLREQDIASCGDHNPIVSLNSSGNGMEQSQKMEEADIPSKGMSIKLIQNKFNQRVLCAETGAEFSDLLFSFLTFPLGAILKCLGGRSGITSVDNLYKSIENLHSESCMKSEKCKTLLLDPKLAPDFNSKNQLLQIEEEVPWNIPSLTKCETCFKSNKDKCLHGLGDIPLNSMNPKYPNPVTEFGGAFLKEPTTFMVTDELVVKPFSTISLITLLSSLNIPLDDIEERVVYIGALEASPARISSLKIIYKGRSKFEAAKVYFATSNSNLSCYMAKLRYLEEAISLLKASLISNSVLTDVFSLEPNPKRKEILRNKTKKRKIIFMDDGDISEYYIEIEDGVLHDDNCSNSQS